MTRFAAGGTMRAIVAEAFRGPVVVAELPRPRPGPGQVLVRVAAAPINPSDQGSIDGRYADGARFPLVPGNEGSGTVVAAGPGSLA